MTKAAPPVTVERQKASNPEHFLRALEGGFGDRRAADDPGQLALAALDVKRRDRGIGAAIALGLGDEQMGIGQSGDLGQMGNAEDLLGPGHGAQLLSYLLGGPSGNAGVHLVEDQGLPKN